MTLRFFIVIAKERSDCGNLEGRWLEKTEIATLHHARFAMTLGFFIVIAKERSDCGNLEGRW
jgi:hypothetical protein